MILAIDIGNTNIKTAVCQNEKIISEWRLSKDSKRTGDEYFSILNPLLKESGIEPKDISDIVLSSVVPALVGPFVNLSKRLIEKKPFIIESAVYKKLPVKIPETASNEIGTDLLCDAVAVWKMFGSSCIVADFGTALSLTAIYGDGTLAGVAIAPGIRTAFNALFSNTAQIPAIPLDIPTSSLGKNTVQAVQSGIVLGYRGLVEGLIKQMKSDMQKEHGEKEENIKVIATGGLNSMLSPITSVFDCVDKNLTIMGMLAIFDWCAR